MRSDREKQIYCKQNETNTFYLIKTVFFLLDLRSSDRLYVCSSHKIIWQLTLETKSSRKGETVSQDMGWGRALRGWEPAVQLNTLYIKFLKLTLTVAGQQEPCPSSCHQDWHWLWDWACFGSFTGERFSTRKFPFAWLLCNGWYSSLFTISGFSWLTQQHLVIP